MGFDVLKGIDETGAKQYKPFKRVLDKSDELFNQRMNELDIDHAEVRQFRDDWEEMFREDVPRDKEVNDFKQAFESMQNEVDISGIPIPNLVASWGDILKAQPKNIAFSALRTGESLYHGLLHTIRKTRQQAHDMHYGNMLVFGQEPNKFTQSMMEASQADIDRIGRREEQAKGIAGERLQQIIENTPENMTQSQAFVHSAIPAITEMTFILGTGIATGGVAAVPKSAPFMKKLLTPSMGSIALSASGQAKTFMNYIEEGVLDPEQAFSVATTRALISYFANKIPLDNIMNPETSRGIYNLCKNVAGELFAENLTELGHYLVDTKMLNEDVPLSELVDRMVDTSISTALMVPVLNVTLRPFQRVYQGKLKLNKAKAMTEIMRNTEPTMDIEHRKPTITDQHLKNLGVENVDISKHGETIKIDGLNFYKQQELKKITTLLPEFEIYNLKGNPQQLAEIKRNAFKNNFDLNFTVSNDLSNAEFERLRDGITTQSLHDSDLLSINLPDYITETDILDALENFTKRSTVIDPENEPTYLYFRNLLRAKELETDLNRQEVINRINKQTGKTTTPTESIDKINEIGKTINRDQLEVNKRLKKIVKKLNTFEKGITNNELLKQRYADNPQFSLDIEKDYENVNKIIDRIDKSNIEVEQLINDLKATNIMNFNDSFTMEQREQIFSNLKNIKSKAFELMQGEDGFRVRDNYEANISPEILSVRDNAQVLLETYSQIQNSKMSIGDLNNTLDVLRTQMDNSFKSIKVLDKNTAKFEQDMERLFNVYNRIADRLEMGKLDNTLMGGMKQTINSIQSDLNNIGNYWKKIERIRKVFGVERRPEKLMSTMVSDSYINNLLSHIDNINKLTGNIETNESKILDYADKIQNKVESVLNLEHTANIDNDILAQLTNQAPEDLLTAEVVDQPMPENFLMTDDAVMRDGQPDAGVDVKSVGEELGFTESETNLFQTVPELAKDISDGIVEMREYYQIHADEENKIKSKNWQVISDTAEEFKNQVLRAASDDMQFISFEMNKNISTFPKSFIETFKNLDTRNAESYNIIADKMDEIKSKPYKLTKPEFKNMVDTINAEMEKIQQTGAELYEALSSNEMLPAETIHQKAELIQRHPELLSERLLRSELRDLGFKTDIQLFSKEPTKKEITDFFSMQESDVFEKTKTELSKKYGEEIAQHRLEEFKKNYEKTVGKLKQFVFKRTRPDQTVDNIINTTKETKHGVMGRTFSEFVQFSQQQDIYHREFLKEYTLKINSEKEKRRNKVVELRRGWDNLSELEQKELLRNVMIPSTIENKRYSKKQIYNILSDLGKTDTDMERYYNAYRSFASAYDYTHNLIVETLEAADNKPFAEMLKKQKLNYFVPLARRSKPFNVVITDNKNNLVFYTTADTELEAERIREEVMSGKREMYNMGIKKYNEPFTINDRMRNERMFHSKIGGGEIAKITKGIMGEMANIAYPKTNSFETTINSDFMEVVDRTILSFMGTDLDVEMDLAEAIVKAEREGKSVGIEDMREKMREEYIKQIRKKKGVTSNYIKRKNIAGFNIDDVHDFTKSVVDNAINTSSRYDLINMFEGFMKKHGKFMPDDVRNSIIQFYRSEIEEPHVAQNLAGKLSYANILYHLGANFASGLRNFLTGHTLPFLTAGQIGEGNIDTSQVTLEKLQQVGVSPTTIFKYGKPNCGKSMSFTIDFVKSMGEAFITGKPITTNEGIDNITKSAEKAGFDSQQIKAIVRAFELGFIDAGVTTEYMNKIYGSSSLGDTTAQALMAPFKASNIYVRLLNTLTVAQCYQHLLSEQGKDISLDSDDILYEAFRITNLTQPGGGNMHKLKAATRNDGLGAFIRLSTSLNNFVFNATTTMLDTTYKAMFTLKEGEGFDGKFNKNNYLKGIMAFTAGTTLLGGLSAMPMTEDMRRLYRKMFREEDIMTKIERGDSILEKFISNGTLGVIWFDIPSLGWGTPRPEDITTLGVAGGALSRISYGLNRAKEGVTSGNVSDIWRGIEVASPSVFKRLMRAMRQHFYGYSSTSGMGLYNDDTGEIRRMNVVEALAHIAGVNILTKNAKHFQMQRIENEIRSNFNAVRTKLQRRIRSDIRSGNYDSADRIINKFNTEIEKFYDKHGYMPTNFIGGVSTERYE